jgi:hypothetical protein
LRAVGKRSCPAAERQHDAGVVRLLENLVDHCGRLPV